MTGKRSRIARVFDAAAFLPPRLLQRRPRVRAAKSSEGQGGYGRVGRRRGGEGNVPASRAAPPPSAVNAAAPTRAAARRQSAGEGQAANEFPPRRAGESDPLRFACRIFLAGEKTYTAAATLDAALFHRRVGCVSYSPMICCRAGYIRYRLCRRQEPRSTDPQQVRRMSIHSCV